MSENARSVLTPDEWAGKSVDIGIGLVWAHLSNDPQDETGDAEALGDKGPWLVIDASRIVGHRFTVAPRSALAALALHGQPFGFTREDVEALRNIASDLHPNSEPFHSLADRIAALLPPESP